MNIWLCLLIGLAVNVVLSYLVRDDVTPCGFSFGLFVSCALSWLIFGETPAWKERAEAEEALRIAAESEPHVIREADGCKVYAFQDGGRRHYFIRCKDQTTTESSYSVRKGKTTIDETESIVTTNSPRL